MEIRLFSVKRGFYTSLGFFSDALSCPLVIIATDVSRMSIGRQIKRPLAVIDRRDLLIRMSLAAGREASVFNALVPNGHDRCRISALPATPLKKQIDLGQTIESILYSMNPERNVVS
jgi:hypothetical protein